ncbi:hypothetical protein FCM35_KLT19913 [Carex littledalei]|uniref:F-box domain-containing protein n=1 Tax=Carex littledalei TaxID=544730 RepID=A0A833RG55_9POAL|nr:hypothetical protein FCM35_KLT19913 [Carex littledalei]
MDKINCSEISDAIDRISNLPDVLLQHILSFLSTKEAVETCVLSKRWKYTWACVPVLDVSLEEFGGPYQEAKFERFVKGVMQNREPSNLEKFRLVWYTKDGASYNSRALERCILQAMKIKPQVLSLSVSKQELLSFDTDPIFTCASLHDVVLEQNLKRHYLKIAPSSVHLPCLKKLHLTRVTVNDDSVDKLFFGCPILEELFLQACNLNVYKISSDKLKKLVLLDCCLEQYLKISTPVLLDLEIRGCGRVLPVALVWENMPPMRTFSWENMASLINARVELPTSYYDDDLTDVGFKLLTNLSNVTNLDLQLSDPQGLLEKEIPNCPIFNNLKTLTLGGWCMSSDFELVAFFLRSPNLQRLTIYNYDVFFILKPIRKWGQYSKEKSRHEEAKGALFQREQLEFVKIIKWMKNNEMVDRLVNKLHDHVKTIGKIIITNWNASFEGYVG